MKPTAPNPTVSAENLLIRSFIFVSLSCYLFIVMEWLFFFTKPSFLDNWTLFESFTVLLIAPLPYILFSLIVLTFLYLFIRLTPLIKISGYIGAASFVLPSVVLASLAFLLWENFTYILWQFNIGKVDGIGRYCYALAIIIFVIWISRVLCRWSSNTSNWAEFGKYVQVLAFGMLSLSLVFTLVKYTQSDIAHGVSVRRSGTNTPNILILSTDGLDATHMSAYGYHRDTTPFIDSLLPQSLVVENHFTNNAKSTGSIGALFSGKLPTRTRVIYPPDIFRGKDVYQHVPGILKKIGYRLGDFSIRHYTDPYDLNLREGFDYANGREIGQVSGNIQVPDVVKRTFMKDSYFLEITLSRLLIRLQHAFSIKDMVNPYSVVTNMRDAKRNLPDSERIEQLYSFIENSPEPFFAHVHLMVTHGSKFNLGQRFFSLGQEQNNPWMTDFYDDSILNYDQIAREIVSYLKKINLYDRTLIVFTSDHGSKWRATERIPLILRFPEQEYRGVRRNNVQRIDVTASILEYLGIEKPDWIEGESFLLEELDAKRPIFYADSAHWGPKDSGGWRNVKVYKAPYYSLGGVGLVVAQKWYFLHIRKKQLYSGDVSGHTSPVEKKHLPSKNQAYEQIIGHLKENNYPIEGLKTDS